MDTLTLLVLILEQIWRSFLDFIIVFVVVLFEIVNSDTFVKC